MTYAQARQIREFRLKGIGYKAIASMLGLSRDKVRNYCKDQCLEGYGPVAAVNRKEQMQQGSVCRRCSKTIRQPKLGRKRTYCSDQCRRQWWAAHPEESRKKATAFYEKTCAYCGKQFTVYGSKNRKYCSYECYVHDRFWWKEEGREPYVSLVRREEANHE